MAMKHGTDLRRIQAFVDGLKKVQQYLDYLFEHAAETKNPEMEGELEKIKGSITYFSQALDPKDLARQRQNAEWALRDQKKRARELRKEAKNLIDN